MSRQQGFARGDFDTSFPLDDRMMRLRASLPPAEFYAAVGVWWHIVAAAWRRAERKPGLLTCPEAPEAIASLVSVGLLDRSERLPLRAYNGWVGRALSSRATQTDRKRRQRGSGASPDGSNPERMSRGTDVGHRGTARDPREGEEGEVRTGTETGGAGGPSDAVDAAWNTATGRTLLGSGEFAARIIEDTTRRHGEAAVVTAIRECRRGFDHVPAVQPLATAIRNRLDPLPSGKDAKEGEQDRARSARAVTATIAKVHGYGGHDDKPDPRCGLCVGVTA